MASSVSETTSELGGALGIAILGSIGSFVYLKQMNANAIGLYKTTTGTFGGDVASAANAFPNQAVMLNLTRDAFTLGMNWAAELSAIITIILTVICYIGFKRE